MRTHRVMAPKRPFQAISGHDFIDDEAVDDTSQDQKENESVFDMLEDAQREDEEAEAVRRPLAVLAGSALAPSSAPLHIAQVPVGGLGSLSDYQQRHSTSSMRGIHPIGEDPSPVLEVEDGRAPPPPLSITSILAEIPHEEESEDDQADAMEKPNEDHITWMKKSARTKYVITIQKIKLQEIRTWWPNVNHANIKYMTWAVDMGQDRDNPHLHIYVQLRNPQRYSTLIDELNPDYKGHYWADAQLINVPNKCPRDYVQELEPKGHRGVPHNAKRHIRGQGHEMPIDFYETYWEQGTFTESMGGARTASGSLGAMVAVDHVNPCDLWENEDHHTQLTLHWKSLTAIFQQMLPRRDETKDTLVYWLYGKPGVGKSWWAHQKAKPHYRSQHLGVFVVRGDAIETEFPFDGYAGEAVVIVDDFPQLEYKYLSKWLQYLDRYECRANCKGAQVNLNVKLFIITAQFHPHNYFRGINPEEDTRHMAWLRRTDSNVFEVTYENGVRAGLPPSFPLL